MLQFFGKIIKAELRKEKTELFRELKKQLLLLADSPSEKQSFDYFDYLSWVESKIENRSFLEIVRKTAAKAEK